MSESFSVDQLIDWSTTLITEVLNSRMALTDNFESREPVDNLSLKHNVILSLACKSWTLCWQCFLKRLLSICRNLKSPSLTITMQEHVHGTAWHVADGYFSRPVPLASSISGIPVWGSVVKAVTMWHSASFLIHLIFLCTDFQLVPLDHIRCIVSQ